METPSRKRLRLPDYDYSASGAYFVTICTQGRRCILWTAEERKPDPVGAAISRPQSETELPFKLSATGRIAEQAIRNIDSQYETVFVDKYVIMPNHVHLILRIEEGASGRMISAPTVSTVIGQMKRWASKQTGESLWQKSFHDHIIRSEGDYREIWTYIDGNPSKWAEDRYYRES